MADKALAIGQLGMDEKVIEDAGLEKQLDEWAAARDAASIAAAQRDKLREAIADDLDKLDIGLGAAVRIGKYRIERKMSAVRDVSFTTEAKERLAIKLVE